MRAIIVMYDSLNRRYLPSYEPECGVSAPNFQRLADRSVQFDTCYAGSMPCMPARREMHTGRYNFLHRGWGPLEPFDDSMPEMLRAAGVTTHLATDHMHYWEDGGATYQTRFGTFDLIRGQQGDPWKGRVRDPDVCDDLRVHRGGTWRQDRLNRPYISGIENHPQTRTFDAGLEFIQENIQDQNWLVQIETFDPHEPFFSDPEFLALYGGDDGSVPSYDWPDYIQVTESRTVQEDVRRHYRALVTMCDRSLGRVLDVMDDHNMWDDTLLIVCTDHGFLLGEQGWWGKSVPPWFEETIHTPLFVWDPGTAVKGERRDALVQTIDLAPTVMDAFGVEPTERFQGKSLRPVLEGADSGHDYALFGAFGGHVSVTDGRYVYMRAPVSTENRPLYEYTLMPTHMRGFFTKEELKEAQLVDPLPFTQGLRVLQTPGSVFTNPYVFGTLLWDLRTDPRQVTPLLDDGVELSMARALRDALVAADAPPSQFERLGLPQTGPVTDDHLLCRAQLEQVKRSRREVPAPESFPVGVLSVHSSVRELMAHPEAREILTRHCRPVQVGPFAAVAEEVSLYHAAAIMIGVIPWNTLTVVADELAALELNQVAT